MTISEFKNKVKSLKSDIEDKILEGGLFPNSIPLIVINTIKDGVNVTWWSPMVKGVVLSNRDPVIYQDNVGGNLVRVVVNVYVDDIVYENKSLNLTHLTYTFNTYSEYLKFFHKRYCELVGRNDIDVEVRGEIKGTTFYVPSVLSERNYNCKPVSLRLSSNDFSNWRSYSALPESLKNEVDTIIAPLTIYSNDVSFNIPLDMIEVRVNCLDLVGNLVKTEFYSNELDRFFQ